jgi:hypothetical protein
MYTGSIPPLHEGIRQVHYRLTEESIRLWRLRTREYVKAVRQEPHSVLDVQRSRLLGQLEVAGLRGETR